VCVLRRAVVFGVGQLKAAYLVAEVQSSHEPRLGQLVKTTEESGLVKAGVSQGIDNVSMAQWLAHLGEPPDDSDPRRRCA